MTDIVQKLWGFCHTLRHDGVDYGALVEWSKLVVDTRNATKAVFGREKIVLA